MLIIPFFSLRVKISRHKTCAYKFLCFNEFINLIKRYLKPIFELEGFLKNLKSNYIQDKIASSANKEQILFDKNDHVLVGINKFQNLNEKAISKIAKSCENDFVKEKNKIRESRLSEKIENDRIENENK